MLEKHLKHIQELETLGFRLKCAMKFGKLITGKYAIVCDYENSIDQKRNSFKAFFRFGVPFVVVFNDNAQVATLDKIDKPVDTEVFFGLKAQKMFRDMKVMSSGTGNFEARPDTIIIRNINLKPFKPKSVLVVRSDSFIPTKISKTTRELPASVYYRVKGGKELKEQVIPTDPTVIAFTAITTLVMTFVAMFMMIVSLVKISKRDKELEKKLKSILKDGKDWKVHWIRHDEPNAFCIATPRIFLYTGLKKILSENEIMAIILHEAGHIKNKDMWKNVGAQSTFLGILIGLAFATASTAAAPAFLVVLSIMSLMNMLGIQYHIFALTLGRAGERNADSTAVKYGYGDYMASALRKLDKWVTLLKSKRPCGTICKMVTKTDEVLDAHPPLKERVENVLKEKDTWELKNFQNISSAKKMWTKKLDKK